MFSSQWAQKCEQAVCSVCRSLSVIYLTVCDGFTRVHCCTMGHACGFYFVKLDVSVISEPRLFERRPHGCVVCVCETWMYWLCECCSLVMNWSEICIMRSSRRASQTLVGCYSWVCSEGSPFKWNSCLWVIEIKVLHYLRACESWFQCFLTHFISMHRKKK